MDSVRRIDGDASMTAEDAVLIMQKLWAPDEEIPVPFATYLALCENLLLHGESATLDT